MIESQIWGVSENSSSWVGQVARPFDISSESSLRLAHSLSNLLEKAIFEYSWLAASSNNVFSTLSSCPMRIIRFPYNQEFISVVNPELTLGGDLMLYYEGCGSLEDNKSYPIFRAQEASLRGYILSENSFEPVNLDLENDSAALAQHEVDHLDGILINMKTNFWEEYRAPLTLSEVREIISNLEKGIEFYPLTFDEENLQLGWGSYFTS